MIQSLRTSSSLRLEKACTVRTYVRTYVPTTTTTITTTTATATATATTTTTTTTSTSVGKMLLIFTISFILRGSQH